MVIVEPLVIMIRVYICGEGKHDIGLPSEDWSTAQSEGWLQIILRRLFGESIECRAVRRRDIVLHRREENKHKPLPKGHGRKALATKMRAKQGGYDLAVFMVDADSRIDKEWCEKRRQVVDGFSRVDGVWDLPCVPMSASESWLLADDQAWAGMGLKKAAALPAYPERIWGQRDNPESDHPHQYFHRVCVAAGVEDSLEARVQVAERSDLDKVKKSCPVSFGAFVSDLAAVQAELE